MHDPIIHRTIRKITAGSLLEKDDSLAVEEPLEIHLEYGPVTARIKKSISVTMRTPGHDPELATGFLFTEGILPDAAAIQTIHQGQPGAASPYSPTGFAAAPAAACNTIHIALHPGVPVDLDRLQRHFYTSSSCGVCGKTSIAALHTLRPLGQPESPGQPELARQPAIPDEPVPAALLYSLPEKLRQRQSIFDSTGGLHAAALFDRSGQLLTLHEDIGRHNALDKLIGHQLKQLPLSNNILLLSGRACFELIQKAAMAGIRIVAAIGPPSSLAAQLAEEQGMTLVGFLKEDRLNVYSGAHRIGV